MKVYYDDLKTYSKWLVNTLSTNSAEKRRLTTEIRHVLDDISRDNTWAYVFRPKLLSDLSQIPKKEIDRKYLNVRHLPKSQYEKVLDVGTVYSEYLDALQQRLSANYVRGINVRSSDVDYHNGTVQNDSRFTFYNGRTIPSEIVPDGGFDLINVRMVLHHVDNFLPLLRSCYDVLAPGGQIYILEHDYNKRDDEFESRVDMLDLVHDTYNYVVNSPARNVPQIQALPLSAICLIDRKDLIGYMKSIGFSVMSRVAKGRSYKDTFMSEVLFIGTK